MKVLTLDIENSPGVAHVWGLFDVNVSLSQLVTPPATFAFAAKWTDSPKVEFRSTFHDGKAKMLERAHALLSEADVLVSYNGQGFDLPHLHREFLLAGFAPPAPVQHVDLYRVAKRHFKFVSFKLDHVSRELGLDGKTSHTGHQLWVDCMAGDEKAWSLMRKYNRQDVILTEQLYFKLLPWVSSHPSVALFDDSDVPTCQCGGTALQKRGFSFTALGKYQRYQCMDCGAWHKGTKRLAGSDVRGVSS